MTFDYRGKKAVVVGLGVSGCSAIDLLVREGAEVVGTDRAPLEKLPSVARKLGVRLVTGGHDGVDFLGADLIVVSPGVPEFPLLSEALKNGVEVIGEVELASRFLEVPLIAIGGTNGKSTATTLIGHLVESAGHRAFVGANLGEPACDAPLTGPDVAVFEVSSFQMERVRHFRPKIAVLLNITEDHLDRYPSFDDYAAAKGNCFAAQLEGDVAIAPIGDELCLAQVRRGLGKVITFGEGGDYFLEGTSVVERESGTNFDLSEVDLHGAHNYMNAAAAIAAVRAMGLSIAEIAEGLRRFRALPHRMALVGRFKGVQFYDDSKATNVGAAVTALRGLTEEKAVLIAGGRDKHGSYDELVTALVAKGRAVVLLGEAAERLEAAIGGRVPTETAKTIEGAVLRAFRFAKSGDAVLLSPACSSLDMFKSYSERGDRFAKAVSDLIAAGGSSS